MTALCSSHTGRGVCCSMQLAAGAKAQCALVLLAHPARSAVRDCRCRCVFVAEFHTVLSLPVSMQPRCQNCSPGPNRADSSIPGAPRVSSALLNSFWGLLPRHLCFPGCSRRARTLWQASGPPCRIQHESDCIGAPAPSHPEVAASPRSMSLAAAHRPIRWYTTRPAIAEGG